MSSYPAFRTLFGDVLSVRLSAADPDCNLLRFLKSPRTATLEFWEQRCALYLQAVENVEVATLKIMDELEGSAQSNSPDEFSGRLGDYFLEICVVRDLSERGCYKFLPLVPPKTRNTPSKPDYRCLVKDDDGEEQQAYVEVKNLRAPFGLVDSFQRISAELSSTHPYLKNLRIVLHHYWDNTALPAHDSAIRGFLLSLESVEVPYSTNLTLPRDVHVRVDLQSGAGDVVLTRLLGGAHSWGPFTESRGLLNKATAHIRKAIGQLSQDETSLKILAINIESPDAAFSTDIGLELQQLVKQESQGSVQCVLFHHHRFLEA